MSLNRKIFKIHSWSGLLSGLFILVFFLTGAIIVFREEINVWENPHLFRVHPQETYLPYGTLYEKVKEQEPGTFLYSFRYIPQKPGETIEMRIYEGGKYGLLYVNPYDGRVLGKTFHSIHDILITLHYTFYLGRIGELMAGIFALALLASIFTGFYIYRKSVVKVLMFRIAVKFKNWRTASSDLHRIIGVWALVFNCILAFSGFYMMLYAFDIKAQFGSASQEQPSVPPRMQQNLDTLVARTSLLLPGTSFRYMDFPRQENDPITVYGYNKNGAWLFGELTNKVAFDNASGEVLNIFKEEDLSAGEKFEYALYTLHYGQYGGTGIKLLYCFFSLASAVMTVTGFLLWYRRKKSHQKNRLKKKASQSVIY